MYFRPRFNALGPLLDCRSLASIRPEIVGETSMVKLEGRGGKCERFRSLSTINYYCMGGELLVAYINQKAAPTYHFVVPRFGVLRPENFKARFLEWVRLVCLVIKNSE